MEYYISSNNYVPARINSQRYQHHNSSLKSGLNLTKLTLAIGIVLSASPLWAACNDLDSISSSQSCLASGINEDAKISLTGNNSIVNPPGLITVQIKANGSGQAEFIQNGELTINNAGTNRHAVRLLTDDEGGAKASFLGKTTITAAGTDGRSAVWLRGGTDATLTITDEFNISAENGQGIELTTQGSIGGDITFSHSGTGTISAENGHAIVAKANGPQGNINIDLRGSGIQLMTEGDSHRGLEAMIDKTGLNLNGSVGIYSNSIISTEGKYSHGIYAAANQGNIDVIQENGQIKTNGEFAYGIHTIANGPVSNGIDVALVNSQIETDGKGAHGIYSVSNQGSVTIKNQGGDILTKDDASHGIAVSAKTSGNDVIAVEQTGGSIKVQGNNSNAIYVGINNAGSSVKEINVAVHDSLLESAGNNNGIFVDTNVNAGKVNVDFTDSTVNSSGNAGHGIYLRNNNTGFSDVDLNIAANGGEINLINPVATGANNIGIMARQYGDAAGNINIINNGAKITAGSVISSSADISRAIYAIFESSTASGNIVVHNSGELTALGQNTAAIQANNKGSGNIDIINTGKIITNGSRGIQANTTSGNSTVNATGDVTLNPTASTSNNHAIYAGSQSGDSIIKYADGTINVDGALIQYSHGLLAATENGKAVIENSNSTINTTGDNSHNVYAMVNNGGADSQGIEIRQIGGSLTTSGVNSHGIIGHTYAKSGDIDVKVWDSAINVKNSNSDGISLQNLNNAVSNVNINLETNGGEINLVDAATTPSGVSNFGLVALQQHGEARGNVNVQNNGTKITLGANADGGSAIYAGFTNNAASSGNVSVVNHGELAINGTRSNGINASHSGIGKIDIVNTGDINAVDGRGIYANAQSGEITITALGDITTGQITPTVYNHAIHSLSQSGNQFVTYANGAIATSGNGALGIYAKSAQGDINIDNLNSTINTTGSNATGLYALSTNSGNIEINSNGDITVQDGKGIVAQTQSGDTLVNVQGNLQTGQSSGATVNHGVESISQSGVNTVNFANGTIKVVGNANSGGNTFGILAWDNGSGDANADASVNLSAGAIVDASEGVGAIALKTNGKGVINIADGAKISGGHNLAAVGKGFAISLDNTAGTTANDYQINNAGLIEALSDQAVRSNLLAGTAFSLNNVIGGVIDGYLTLSDEDTLFTNEGDWNIRHFADTDGDGVRDQKAVTIADFGSGNDTVKNESTGVIRLVAEDPSLFPALSYDPVYLGYQTAGALDISYAGINQGQLVNVNRFENRGTIDLSANGLAGDVLAVTGNAQANGTSGNGVFLAEGGSLILDTVLNEGGANSLSDVLVVDNFEAGSEKTKIIINHVSGIGALTQGDGIKVVEVLDNAQAGSFELGHVVKGGLYEYTLHEGSQTVAGENSLFLRTSALQRNPDVGSYLINQSAATGLFMHSLHDRLGEPQFYQNYRAEDKAVPAMWLRAVSGRTKNETAGGLMTQTSDETLLHLGGEVANWTGNGDDRYHLGVMGAYGRSEAKTTSKATGTKVDSKVDGYGVGAYLTWYGEPAAVEGWYSDLWGMYNWFNNETEGSDKYNSSSWTVSFESGYELRLNELTDSRYDWMLEPQVQIAYHHYKVDSIKDRNGLAITNPDGNGVTTRLGMRTYLRPTEGRRNGAQPFVEVNWLYNSTQNSMVFNGEKISDDTPKNRFEAKAGIHGEVTKNVEVYTHIGLQRGQNSYKRAEGQIGLRVRF